VALAYFVFDVLFLAGKDLRNEAFVTRRKLLAKLLQKPQRATDRVGLRVRGRC
jgi:ATP-dependent DNA ligase